MPRFHDYHRTVIGYHGTRRSAAMRIVQGLSDFKASENTDDWLGHGVYFWEYAPKQAWVWARQRQRRQGWTEEIAVLGCMIRLGNCFDLLDPDNVRMLTTMHASYIEHCTARGIRPPVNVKGRKYLDCAVFEYAYEALAEIREPVDTCRAVYVPQRERAWPHSWITPGAHIQLCVRNEASILGTWLVKPAPEDGHDLGKART